LNQTGHGPDRLATMQGYFFAVTQCGSTGPKKRSATCLARDAVVWRKEIAVDQIMHWQFPKVNNSLGHKAVFRMGPLADVIRPGTKNGADCPLKLWNLRRVARQVALLLRGLLLQNPPPTYHAPKDFALRAACTHQKTHTLQDRQSTGFLCDRPKLLNP
jgi:hypothetical protein